VCVGGVGVGVGWGEGVVNVARRFEVGVVEWDGGCGSKATRALVGVASSGAAATCCTLLACLRLFGVFKDLPNRLSRPNSPSLCRHSRWRHHHHKGQGARW